MDKKIIIDKNSIIYVLCPAYHKTGGTELLHQYVFTANERGLNCKIVYTDPLPERNINPGFLEYVQDYLLVSEVEDRKGNVLIVPEIYTGYLKHFKRIRKVVWWESVDNYAKYALAKFNLCHFSDDPIHCLYRLAKIFFRIQKNASLRTIRRTCDFHFAQSFYALDFLKRHRVEQPCFYVSDYINQLYLSESNTSLFQKQNIVCYNPAKGKRFTNRIIAAAKGLVFVPLVGMSNSQVVETLRKAKVYIDFGNHPGKDRFPREAATMGCCIITNKRGAAGFFEDVPIESEFKFAQKRNQINLIVEKIRQCLDDFEVQSKKFEEYRERIRQEKSRFTRDLFSCYEII